MKHNYFLLLLSSISLACGQDRGWDNAASYSDLDGAILRSGSVKEATWSCTAFGTHITSVSQSKDPVLLNSPLVFDHIQVTTKDARLAGLKKAGSPTQLFPVMVSPGTGITNIELSDLAGILEGTITNWSQVGGNNGTIRLYLHNGLEQRRILEAALRRTHISTDKLEFLCTKYPGDGYEHLRENAAADSAAIVLGLKSSHAIGLEMISLNGIFATSREAYEKYPLKLVTDVYYRSTPEGHRALQVSCRAARENAIRPTNAIVKSANLPVR